MLYLSHVRQRYGDAFVTVLPDGRQIPWRLLSIEDYLKYQTQITSNAYPLGCIHDEIFKKCVLDKELLKKCTDLPAGIATIVAISILEYSGPADVSKLAETLEYARFAATQIFPQMISLTCWAFPSYTPDDLYKLDYYTFMERLALAEAKLMNQGLLKEPLSFNVPKEQVSKQPEPPKKETVLEQLKQAYQKENTPSYSIPRPASKPKTQQTVITKADIQEAKAAYTNHERSDADILEHKMVEESTVFYKDYLDQLQKNGKIVIKTDEQRKAEALNRAKQNEILVNKMNAELQVNSEAELAKLKQKKISKKEKQLNARNKKRR